ncbi:TolB family protein, partial [Sphingopyxis sp.]|uniref:TolB family protein n=1 Tax=Sphingopyxis sp. TaxID=1908224 RepID=UPI002EEABE4F
MMVNGSLLRRAPALRAAMLAGCMAAAAALSVSAGAFAQPGAATSEAHGHKAVQPDDIMSLTDAVDTEISPDGRHVLYVTQPTIATSRPSRSEIWIVAADGKSPARRLTKASMLDGSPQWSPDGRTIAFLSKRAEAVAPGAPKVGPSPIPAGSDQSDSTGKLPTDSAARPASSRQLWLISADGSGERRLTSLPRDVSRFRWSPDSQSIAFLAPDGPPANAQKDRSAQGEGIVADAPRDLSRIWIIDLRARDIRRLAVADRDVTDLSWSPDGRRLAVRAAPTTGLNDLFYHSELLILDVASGAVERKLFDRVFSTASWSPDGSQVAFTAPGEGTIGIRAFVADVEKGAARELGTTLDGTIRQLEWSRDSRRLVARVVVRSRDVLFSADAATGVFRPFVEFGGRIGAFAEADDGSIAIAGSQPDRAADIWVYRGGELRRLTELNPQMREWGLGKVEEISWTSS